MLKTISNFYVVTLLFCTLTIGLILSSSHVSSASTTADAAVTVGSACTMTATVDTPHNAEIPNGTNRTEIGTTTLNTICNDSGGFAIYAVGYSNNEYGNTTMINQADSSITFNTGTATSGSNSNWSMKLSQVTTGTFATTIDNSFNNYHNVPNTYTKVAHRDSATDAVSANPATGTSISATYQTFISPTQAAGTYQGKVKYTMVHPAASAKPVHPLNDADCPIGNICYSVNSNDIQGSMSSLGEIVTSSQAGKQSVSGTTATLIAPNYKRVGYGFAGWSTDYKADNSSKIYGPNETIDLATGEYAENEKLILYPVWVESTGVLQTWTGCSGLTPTVYESETGNLVASLDSITALTDIRDGNTYAIARLADNNCWMIDNLRLNSEYSTDSSLAQGFGGIFIGLDSSEDNFTTTATPTGIYDTETNITGAQNGSRMPRYNNNNTKIGGKNASGKTLTPSYNNNTNAVQWFAYGNYYTWSAAIANTKYYNNMSGSDAAGTSICPKSWRLPFGGIRTTTNFSFSKLDYEMGGTGDDQSTEAASKRWRKFPNNYVYSGYYDGTLTYYRGERGYYWPASTLGEVYAYRLYIGAGGIGPGTEKNLRVRGFTLRCVTSGT